MRQKYVKGRIILLALSVMISGLFAGCGEGKPMEKAGDQPLAKITLSFWSWANDTDYIRTVYETAISAFNRDNKFGVEIKPIYIPGEQYKTKLQTEMAANSAPDIFNMWPAGKMEPYVEAGRIYPIGKELNKDAEWKSRYLEGVFKDTTFRNVIYGIPQIRVNSLIYYNKKMFETYGLQPPKTWSELLNVVKTLKDNGKYAFALDAKDPWIGAMYAEYIADRIDPAAYGHAVKDGDWMSPAYVEMGRKISELASLKAFPKDASELDYIGARMLFDEEKAAMYLQGNWDIGYLADQSPIKDKVGIMRFPVIEGGKGDRNNWLAGIEAVIAVSAQCSSPKAAASFLKYLSEKEIAQNMMVEKGGYISTVKVQPDSAKMSKLYKEMTALISDAKDNFTFYDVALGPVVGDEFNNTIQSIITGTLPEDALKKLERTAKKELGIK